MLEQKLINTDGLNKLWGEHLVWFDSVKYHLISTEDPQSEDIRKYHKHWVVLLTGNVDEDISEIQRQTFLTNETLDECLCDIGIVEDNCGIEPEDIIKRAVVDKNGDVSEDLFLKEHLALNNKNTIAVYEIADDNQTKTAKIISGAIEHGYTLKEAMIWAMQLGYMAQDKIVKQLEDTISAVESWTI